MGFARLNKAQRIAIEMKDSMDAYVYKPKKIISIIPGTQFPDNPMNKNEKFKRDKQATLERFRTSEISRRQNQMRFYRGRYWAHEKFYSMKQEVQKIKD